jgi:hypothetical protein
MSQSGEMKVSIPNVNLDDNYVTLFNATPGLTHARLIVNGTVFNFTGLANGSSQTLNIGGALVAGPNTVQLEAFGNQGAGATISFAGSPGQAPAQAGGFAVGQAVSFDSLNSDATYYPPTSITISQSGNQVILSWPAVGPDGAGSVYSSPSLGSDANWTLAGVATPDGNGNYTLTVPVSGSAQYFSLGQP